MNLCLLLRQDAFLARDSFQRGTRPLPSQVARATPTDCFLPNGHPPFAPFFRAHIFRQIISWSLKDFSRLRWNKMRVFQKHFYNFLGCCENPPLWLSGVSDMDSSNPTKITAKIFYFLSNLCQMRCQFGPQISYWTPRYRKVWKITVMNIWWLTVV